MVELLSPLDAVRVPALHPDASGAIGVVLGEVAPGSIVEVAAFPGKERELLSLIASATGLDLPDGAGGGAVSGGRAGFAFAPRRFLLVDEEPGLGAAMKAAVPVETGSVTDLTHGRTAIQVAGPRAEWVLAKFFAIDFSLPAFPLHAGLSTSHHDIFAQIHRLGPDRFDLYVFRSFARSFWKALCHASEEVGYEVR